MRERNIYPCDIPDMQGNLHCPYEDQMDSSGMFCRNQCGLGLDEDPFDYNDEENDDDGTQEKRERG